MQGKDSDEGQNSSLPTLWIKSRKKRKIEREDVTGGDIEKDRKRDRSRLCGRWAERWRRVESAHFSPVQGTTRYLLYCTSFSADYADVFVWILHIYRQFSY
jgi:hypothetical protein